MIIKKYIYLSQDGFGAVLCNADYNSSKITQIINTYSIESGANVVEKTYLGDLINYQNGRIIDKKTYHSKSEKKVKGLCTDSKIFYFYKIIENENKFIKTLISSFKTYNNRFAGSYILLNFSEIYDMLINNELSDNDILFLQKFFNEFEITPEHGYLKYETLQQNKETAAIKNYNLLNLLKKQNLKENNQVHCDNKSVNFDLICDSFKESSDDSEAFDDIVKKLKK